MAKIFRKNLLLTEIGFVLFIILAGGLTFHYVEGFELLDAFYFIVCTMSTIGFWDIAPQTDMGKIFVMIYAFLWVPFFISIWWLILENRFRSTIEKYIKKVNKEIQEAESQIQEAELEIQTVEKSVKKLKMPVQVTEEKIENLEEQIEEKQTKTTRWKKIFKK